MDLKHSQNPAPSVEAPARGPQAAPETKPSADGIKAASAEVSQTNDRPVEPAAPNEKLLAGFEQDGPATGPAPAAEPAVETRSVNELVKDPKVREALQGALDNGGFKYDSLKAVVKEGLETGEFKFKSAGQERVVKSVIADAISPAPATEPSSAPEVESPAAERTEGAPAAEGPEAGAPKQSTLDRAFDQVEAKLPDGLDSRVKEVLNASPAANAARNTFQKNKDFNSSKPSVSDAVRYANATAVKTGDFSAEHIDSRFTEAFGQKTKGDLIKLAEDNGVRLYPESMVPTGQNGRTRSPETAVEPESKYGRAITEAQAKGATLPEPADGKAYTVGEAREFHEKGLIHLESVARSAKPAGAEPKPQASVPEKAQLIDTVNAGYTNKEGGQAKGVAFEDFKNLSRPSQNELRSVVKQLSEGTFANTAEAAGSIAISSALAMEFKEKVLDKQAEAAAV